MRKYCEIQWNFNGNHWRKYVWICRLRNVVHFVSASMLFSASCCEQVFHCRIVACIHMCHTYVQWLMHYSDVIMGTMASQITSLTIVCLLNRLFRRWPKKTLKLRVTGLCAGNSPVTGEFPAQTASKAETVSIWWRHPGIQVYVLHGSRLCGAREKQITKVHCEYPAGVFLTNIDWL